MRDASGRSMVLLRDPDGIVQGTPMLSPMAFEVLRLMDGTRTLQQIRTAYMLRGGSPLELQEIEGLVSQLRHSLVLHGNALNIELQRRRDEYDRLATRPCSLAGESYPQDPDHLRAYLDRLFDQVRTGSREPESSVAPPRGIVAPHIDFERGGPSYGYAYHDLRRSWSIPARELRILLLGTSHRPTLQPFVVSSKGYDTPLGALEVDNAMVGLLRERLGDAPFQEEILHAGEHSLEFQAILLGHLFPPEDRPRILPILCGSVAHLGPKPGARMGDARYRQMIDVLRDVLLAWGDRSIVLAGADLAHMGTQFGDPPLTDTVLAEVEAADHEMLDLFAAGDVDGFYRSVTADGDPRKICGLSPMTALLDLLDAPSGEVRDYRYWHDPRLGSMVSFAAVVFPRKDDGRRGS